MSDSFESLSQPDDGASTYPDVNRTLIRATDTFFDFSENAGEVITSACNVVRPELLVMRLRNLFTLVGPERISQTTSHNRTITQFHRELGHHVYLQEVHFNMGRITSFAYDLGGTDESLADSKASFRLWLPGNQEHVYDVAFKEHGIALHEDVGLGERVELFEELCDDFIIQWLDGPSAESE